MTSPGGSVVRIIISGVARTGAAFAAVRASLARFVMDARVAARRAWHAFVAGGGLPGLIRRGVAAAGAWLRALPGHAGRAARSVIGHFRSMGAAVGRFARSIGRALPAIGRMAMSAGSAAAPVAVLAAKILLVAAAVTTLLGVGGNLLGIVQLLAPAAIAGGVAMAVFKMALSGVADAMKAGIEGDVEKLNEALKKLSPSAKSAVLTMLDLRREWKSTQRTVQEKFFAGFRSDVIAVSRALQPIADRWLPRIADAFAMARTALRHVLTEAAKSGQLDKIMEGIHKFFFNIINAVGPLAQAFLDVAEVASGAFGNIGSGIAGAAQKFADWIREMKNNGKLKEWLDKAITAFKQLGEIGGNIGEILGAFFRGASDQSENFLQKLVRITQQMADWLNGADGQKVIGILSSILGWLIACEPAFNFIIGRIDWMITQFGWLFAAGKACWEGILAIVKFVIMWILDGYGLLVNGAAKAFGWVPGIGEKLKNAAKEFNQFRDNVNNSLNGIQKTIDITVNYRARLIGNHLHRGDEFSGEYRGGGGRAHGGLATGTILAGERGPELIELGAGGGRVTNHLQTAAMMGGGGSGGTRGNVPVGRVTPARGWGRDPFVRMVSDLFSSGKLKMKVDSTGRVRVAT